MLIRRSRFFRFTLAFIAIFLICSLVIWLADTPANTFGDGLWFSFEVVSTIGFGDVLAETPVARIVTVVLSVISIFYIALVTGIVVSYLSESAKESREGTFENFMRNINDLDNLDNLEKLNRDELKRISQQFKKFRDSRFD